MIEFALLFGLGFLTAAFVVLLVTPAIHRRVVRFTENRMRATMPLSPREVRAQKDMVRAVYAAENAKAGRDLIKEREKALTLQLSNENHARENGRLLSEAAEVQMQINDMNVEAADLRSQLRRDDNYVGQLKARLDTAEQANVAARTEIDTFQKRINRLATDIDNLKVDLATRDTQIESLKFRVNALRDERDTLNQDVRLVTQRAKDAERHLNQEMHKSLRIEDRLARDQAVNADKDTLIERRTLEVARLKERLKQSNAEMRDINRTLRQAGLPRPAAKPQSLVRPVSVNGNGSNNDNDMSAQDDQTEDTMNDPLVDQPIHPTPEELAEDIRNQSTALTERLQRSRNPAHDAALRDEIAAVAAKMVVLTAMNEGEASPIHSHLEGIGAKSPGARTSLADRILDMMPEEQPVA